MHPNPIYRKESHSRSLAFVRERAFGTLAVNAEAGPLLSHVPFLLSDDNHSADFHLVRSNPIARLGAVPAVLAVTGPDSYISPDWYGIADQVPTWNYVAVHLLGRIEPLPASGMRDMLDRQSAAYEARLSPKPPWTISKMSSDAFERLLRMILPFRLHIESVEGTWKLSQNKSDKVRLLAAGFVAESGIGQELASMTRLMRDVERDGD